jgi:hypothetical protein
VRLPYSRYFYLMKNGTAMPIRASDSVSAEPIHLGIPDFERLALIESDEKPLGPAQVDGGGAKGTRAPDPLLAK